MNNEITINEINNTDLGFGRESVNNYSPIQEYKANNDFGKRVEPYFIIDGDKEKASFGNIIIGTVLFVRGQISEIGKDGKWFSDEFNPFSKEPIVLREYKIPRNIYRKFNNYQEAKQSLSLTKSNGEVIKEYKYKTLLYVYSNQEIIKIRLTSISISNWIKYFNEILNPTYSQNGNFSFKTKFEVKKGIDRNGKPMDTNCIFFEKDTENTPEEISLMSSHVSEIITNEKKIKALMKDVQTEAIIEEPKKAFIEQKETLKNNFTTNIISEPPQL